MKVDIICGISGSGKSTYAKNLGADIICSVDDYFVNAEGEYEFNHAMVEQAHKKCLRLYASVIVSPPDSASHVVVDNANTMITAVAPYAALARAFDHDLEITILECDPVVAARRNIHNVPLADIMAQFHRIKELQAQLSKWWPYKIVKAGM